MKSFKKLKSELLKDAATKKLYRQLGPKYQVIRQLINARISRNITQKSLAQKIGTKQSSIARFESGSTNPTLEFLQSLTTALGRKLEVKVI